MLFSVTLLPSVSLCCRRSSRPRADQGADPSSNCPNLYQATCPTHTLSSVSAPRPPNLRPQLFRGRCAPQSLGLEKGEPHLPLALGSDRSSASLLLPCSSRLTLLISLTRGCTRIMLLTKQSMRMRSQAVGGSTRVPSIRPTLLGAWSPFASWPRRSACPELPLVALQVVA